jgi:hypothetical protein
VSVVDSLLAWRLAQHGQSWKVAEKLKDNDSYVILCV